MTTQPKSPAPQTSQTGQPEADRDSIRRASSDEPVLYVALFIAFFTAIITFLTVNDFNNATKTLPEIVNSFITQNAGTATLAAIGLSLMTVHACKFSRFIANRVSKRRTGPFVKGPGV